MASVSVSHMILFIASLIVAASVAGTLTSGAGRLTSALDDQSLDVSEDVRTNLEIISDAGSPVYDRDGNRNITLLVKNTGTRNLPPDGTGLDVLVDGRYQTNVTVELVDAGASTWETNAVVRLRIDAGTLDSGDHRVKLVMDSDEEVFSFST